MIEASRGGRGGGGGGVTGYNTQMCHSRPEQMCSLTRATHTLTHYVLQTLIIYKSASLWFF